MSLSEGRHLVAQFRSCRIAEIVVFARSLVEKETAAVDVDSPLPTAELFKIDTRFPDREPLIFKAIAYEVVEGYPSVVPTDFLALGVGAAMIDNGNFVDAGAELRHFDSHLGFDAEAVGVEMHAL